MKKLLSAVFCLLLTHFSQGQALGEAGKLLLLGKYEEAKKEIDRSFSDPNANENPAALLLKAKIYAELFFDSQLKVKYPDAGDQAYKAFKQYVKKDPSLTVFGEENGIRPLSILYRGIFIEGRQLFTESKWEEALGKFTVAEDLGDFISKNGLGSNRQNIDTFTVIYAGFAAQNAKKTARAAYYYRKFADEKIGGQDFIGAYVYLLTIALEENNRTDLTKYLAIARQLYPEERQTWDSYEFEYMSKHAGVAEMLATYEARDRAGELGVKDYLAYAEYFSNVQKSELEKLDNARRARLTEGLASQAYSRAFGLEKNPVYAFNAGVLYYQHFNMLEDTIWQLRGTPEELKKKREEILKRQQRIVDLSVQWLEKSYEMLKVKTGRDKRETSLLSRSVDVLANLYQWKRDKARGVNEAAYNDFDKRYKHFDEEHGKYQ